jgi:hypothetical protein
MYTVNMNTSVLDAMDEINTEILTAQELALKLKVKPSWVIEASRPARQRDPLPVLKIGRHNRYAWNSKSMNAWLMRRGLK